MTIIINIIVIVITRTMHLCKHLCCCDEPPLNVYSYKLVIVQRKPTKVDFLINYNTLK